MQTLALRLHGKNDLRLERFELPEPRDDEILADVTTNSICMSDHKAAAQGPDHKRVPKDIAQNPVIIGHEFCGTLLRVGAKWRGQFSEGRKYAIQPALNIPGAEHKAPGYSFPRIGGQATRILIPNEVMELGCLLPYDGEAFFDASLAEPVSCIIGGYKTSHHNAPGSYVLQNGLKPGGAFALLAGAGPMGLGAIDLALNGNNRPGVLLVTDIDQARLDRAAQIFPPAPAAARGIRLHYLNTAATPDPVAAARALNNGGLYDDVMVMAPVAPLIEQGSALLGYNGCLNFFAGPGRPDFKAAVNFYDVHYMGHHVVGSSGGNTDDLREALALSTARAIRPAVMVTHVGGMDAAAEATLNLPKIPGGKKLIYTHLSMPLTAIEDFAKSADPLLRGLASICEKHSGLWSLEAERHLLAHGRKMASP